MKNTTTSRKTRRTLATPSVFILTQPREKNSHLIGRGDSTLPLRVLIPKNLSTLKSNISFHIELLDEIPTRQVRSLTSEMALKTSILTYSIISHMPYHPNRKNYYNKFNQINQRTSITLNKRKETIHIREMRSKENLLNPTPNMHSIRTLKKINGE